MKIYNKNELDFHYKNIYEKHKEKLLKGGVGDKFLTSPDIDTRMSLVLLIRISKAISEKISLYLNEIKAIEPDLYFYPKEAFHITVMDILRGAPNRTIPNNIEDYIQCIRECTDKINPFYIKFKGITASDNALLIKGYYEYGLEELRQLLRKKFANNNLSLEERYKTISSHITVMRIPDKLSNPNAIVKSIKRNIEFGEMQVNSLELVFHNWYDSKKTLLANFSLSRRTT